ncbi:sugar ABC transporter substrate-binding protein [Phyllobacterium salinisoli]|uniref:Sugar ABC transporter substrate-binding protein n=2 Tax=Phyllobacterium salinisoli TaxID=1899321 RepID=A0A368K0A0_9HYPH|nr:polysaccharide biosynthesis/export family protein [Phyllobacterium salinisoli]RCS22651.1 sugar ABC transporter substrate-binding protein [Phyllobacterium salinisoli]
MRETRAAFYIPSMALKGTSALIGLLWLGSVAAHAAEAGSYKINPNDVLQITVFGQADLTGQYPVAVDGSLGYPIVGNVAVSGLTPSEVGERLGKALAQHIPGLAVTVSIGQYAPVFVLGDIRTPGKYEYRPGMIALELLALGGGAGRGESPSVTAGMQMISAQQEYADVQLQVFALQVRRARTEAELEGHVFEYALPATANQDDGNALKQRVIDGEKTLFTIRRNTLAAEERALGSQVDSFSDEIKTLQASIRLHNDEIALLQENVNSSKTLVDRGLAAKSSLREMERELSSTRRDALELGSFLARARQNQLAVQQRIASLGDVRRNESAASLQEIDLSLARMKRKSQSLLESMAEIARSSGNVSSSDIARKMIFTVLRSDNNGYQEIAGNERTEMKPGDILRVEFDLSKLSGPRS